MTQRAKIQFYLVGPTPRKIREVDVHLNKDLKALRNILGQEFHIVEPGGINFQTEEEPIHSVEMMLQASTPIGITIDGKPVRNAPGPVGLPIVGNFYEIFPDHLGNHARLFSKYGPVIKTNTMGKTTYHTNDPIITGHLLSESAYFTKKITSDHPLWGIKDNSAIFVGDTETHSWLLAHKFLPPCLSPKAIRHYTPLMQRAVRSSLPVFDAMDEANESWNVYQYMLKLASQTIGKFCLGLDFHHFDSPDSPLDPIVDDISAMLVLNKRVTSRGEWYGALPFGDAKRLKEVRHRIYSRLQTAMDSVEQRDTSDLPLSEAALKATCVVDYIKRATDEAGSKLPEDLFLGNIVIMTAAGFTTTSSLLSWMIYSAVTYEGQQERLLQELVDHDVSNVIDWSPDLAGSLKYLDKFVKETQRLHNPSFQPARTTKTDVIVPGGYHLPANSVVVPALYAIHSNPKFWDNPARFDPDRWDTPQVKQRHRCAFLPFATGPRGCIGFNFALQEVKILFAELIYRYELTSESQGAIEYDPDFQLIRPMNIYVRARRRTSWPANTK
ncbi:uncharacterized protein Z519_04021 [Cladophialophora bantiana CBS 173.52]|uniref:Cytochrome P450 monooxygenase n=1 Tax=Cladophialophora bantiana (strain ATCC 10958 / CBS 173.52 / CDC B-1940 / NIH 8579) TaxID=1442370 RepID=A0A0D2GA33_CLAB1|nr:uncharacterized protein Z519_04021 [Cladophialophora bantiana CBS 173.52]KIW95437.1 hypothetical protein Z519_04021 [Cladophialophora bantiana CBS 173.52]